MIGVPTGSVRFLSNGALLGTATLAPDSHTVTYTTSRLPGGTDSIRAVYSGDSLFASSTSQASTINVSGLGTSTALTVSPATVIAGQPETLTVTVRPVIVSQTQPSGSITYLDTNGNVLGTSNLGQSLTSQLVISTLLPGQHTLTAVYSGDTNYATSTSPPQTVIVTRVTSRTTVLTITPAITPYRTPVTFRASVAGVHSGQVVFCEALAPACSATSNLAIAEVNPDGIASVKLPAGSIGAHEFIVGFLGTGAGVSAVPASTSAAVKVTVTGAYPSATTVSAYGAASPYKLTGTVTGIGSQSTPPTGQVTFNDTSNTAAPLLGTVSLGPAIAGFSAATPAGSPLVVGSGPYGVTTGDFNGDGFMDVVTANSDDGTVSVLLGNGDGSFKAPVTLKAGTALEAIAAADFNGDGFLDLVVGTYDSTTGDAVNVLLGNGDGTFKVPVSYATGFPSAFKVLDLNHDGFPDIAASSDGNLIVLINNGDGSFQAAVNYPSTSYIQSLTEADVNGDGNVDIVVVSFGQTPNYGVFLGNGDGTFKPQQTYPLGVFAYDLKSGDFNGDGKTDLALANSDETVGILIGNGDGTFQSMVNYPEGTFAQSILLADFNGDGNLDITVGGETILLGNGNGTFRAPTILPGGYFASGFSAADFDGDGLPDLVGTDSAADQATILLSQVTQTANATLASAVITGAGIHNLNAVYAGDENFTGSTSPAFLLAIAGSSGSPIAPVITWPVPAPITDDTPLSATQLDALATDAAGAPIPGTYVYTPVAGSYLSAGTQTLGVTFTPNDTTTFTPATKTVQILVTIGPYDSLSPSSVVFPRQAIGTSSKAVTISVNSRATLPQSAVSVSGDFTQASGCVATANGEPGCYIQVIFTPAATGLRTGTLKVQSPTGGAALTVALSGIGLPADTLPGTTSTSLAVTGAAGSYLFTGTVTGDLGVGAPTGSVSFLETTANNVSLGAATLGPATIKTSLANGPSTRTGSEPNQVVTADLTGDGRQDVVVLNLGGATNNTPSLCTLNIRLSNGDGTFTAKPDLPSPGCAQAIAIGDFNGDGRADIALSPSGTALTVYFGNGDGTFTEKSIPLTSDPGTAIAAGDFNGDGRSDLVLGTASTGSKPTYSTIILFGQADGSFVTGAKTQVSGSSSFVVADFNGDGKADYAFGSSDGVAVSLGNGDGTFQDPVDSSLGTLASDFSLSAAGDFTGDGKADLVLSGSFSAPPNDNYTNGFLVLVSTGDGKFTTTQPVAISDDYFSNTPTATVADFNGDGLADIAYLDAAVQVFISNGDGTFKLADHVDSGVNTDPEYLAVAAGDFNGDGLPDIISVDSDTSLATVTLTQRTETATAALANVTLSGAGEHLIEAVYAGDRKFLTSTSPTVTVSTTLLTQSITFAPLSGQTFGVAPFNLVATASSGLPVSFVVTGPAKATAALLAITGAGKVTVTASQAGNGTYAAATPVSQTFIVMRAAPVVSWLMPASITLGTPLSANQLDATAAGVTGAPLPGTFAYHPSAGTVLGAGTQTLSVEFSPADAADYTIASQSTTIAVAKATPNLTWATPAAITYGTALSSTQLNAVALDATGAVLPGTFAYTPAAGTVPDAGTQALKVVFTPADLTDYVVATRAVSLLVNKATPVATWSMPTAITQGTPLSATQLDAAFTGIQGTPLPGTATYTPPAGSILGVGTQTLSVFFTPTNSADYKSINATTTLVVERATATLSWATPAPIVYGTALSATQLDAVASGVAGVTLPGTFTYSPAAGTVLNAGPQTLSVTFTPADTTDYGPATKSILLTVTRASPVLTWAAPAPIPQGTALSATQLDATATGINGTSLPGVFAYTPVAGTVLGLGTHTLSVTFTPTDALDYTSAMKANQLQILTSANTAGLTSSAARSQYGQPVTFTATLAAAAANTPAPTGSFTFRDGGALLGASPLSGNKATLTVSTLTAGTHSITAMYPGDANYAATTSPILMQTVAQAIPQIAWTPATSTIVYGTALSSAQLDATATIAGPSPIRQPSGRFCAQEPRRSQSCSSRPIP